MNASESPFIAMMGGKKSQVYSCTEGMILIAYESFMHNEYALTFLFTVVEMSPWKLQKWGKFMTMHTSTQPSLYGKFWLCSVFHKWDSLCTRQI
jgi:hypothetical protein